MERSTGFKINEPGEFLVKEFLEFEAMLRRARTVDGQDLKNRLVQANRLLFLREGRTLAGIGAIKHPSLEYRLDIFRRAEVPEPVPTLELGWFFIEERLRGRGLATKMVAQLLQEVPRTQLLFAVVKESNLPMIRALQSTSFEAVGNPFKSKRGDYNLSLLIGEGRLDP